MGSADDLARAIAFLALLGVLLSSRQQALRIIIRRATVTGFTSYFIFWVLLCWSAWRPEYGLGAFISALFFSSVVGTIGAVAYGVFGAGSFWAYHAAFTKPSR